MNKKAVLIFLTVFFGIYTLVNYYIYSRGLDCLPEKGNYRFYFTILYSVIFSSFIIGKILERTHLFRLSRPVGWVSSFWMGAILYFFLIILLIDIVRLADYFISFLPSVIYCSCSNTKELLFVISVIIVFLLLLGGFINARNPVTRNISLKISKKAGNMKKLNIAAVSDIHMGILFGRKRTARLAQKIKNLNPDIILFIGDVIDEVPMPVIEMDMGAPLRELIAPLGKYAVTGNHEFIGGIKKCSAYLESLGIRLLRDEMTLVNEAFLLAGRDDRDAFRFTGIKRKELAEVLAGRNEETPLILMDHQPFHLVDSEKLGVDLQLSGHTHHGQLWPISYITKAIFELSWGYLKKGNTHYYVSCGYGTWVPQIRIGNRPEILNIELNFF
jgi:uncharacterized protein